MKRIALCNITKELFAKLLKGESKFHGWSYLNQGDYHKEKLDDLKILDFGIDLKHGGYQIVVESKQFDEVVEGTVISEILINYEVVK